MYIPIFIKKQSISINKKKIMDRVQVNNVYLPKYDNRAYYTYVHLIQGGQTLI